MIYQTIICVTTPLHIRKERSPTSWAVMSERGNGAVMSERCDADCAASQQMRNGLKFTVIS